MDTPEQFCSDFEMETIFQDKQYYPCPSIWNLSKWRLLLKEKK